MIEIVNPYCRFNYSNIPAEENLCKGRRWKQLLNEHQLEYSLHWQLSCYYKKKKKNLSTPTENL